MGLIDLLKGTSPVTAVANSIVDGASSIIKDFKADPTKVAESEAKLQELKISAQTAAGDLEAKLAETVQKEMDSARTMNSTIVGSDKAPILDKIVPYLLAALVTAGFFGVLGFMLWRAVPDSNKSIMDILIGSLGTAWIGIVNFYFGSSAGSKAKDQHIQELTTPASVG